MQKLTIFCNEIGKTNSKNILVDDEYDILFNCNIDEINVFSKQIQHLLRHLITLITKASISGVNQI